MSVAFGLAGGARQNGPIVWEVEPGGEGPYVDDIFDAVGLRGPSRCLVDVIRGGPGGRIQESHELLVDKGRYTVLRRACPRCTLCNQCCTRSGSHRLCAHIDRPDALQHLWYLMPAPARPAPARPRSDMLAIQEVIVQGHMSLAGIGAAEEVFGSDHVQEELRMLRQLMEDADLREAAAGAAGAAREQRGEDGMPLVASLR